jgi:hypothetical protein
MKKFLSLVIGLISLLAVVGSAFGSSTARYLHGVKARATALQTGGGTTKTSGKKGHKVVKKGHHKGGKKSKKNSGGTTTPPPK